MKYNMVQKRTLVSMGAIIASIATSPDLYAADEDTVFEEIIVTAQKRESAIQDVALSVPAMTESMLENAGAVSLEDLGDLFAGVEVLNINPGSNRVIARGVMTLTGGFEGTATMGLYVDETPLTAFAANFPEIAF